MINIQELTQTYHSGKGVFELDFTVREGEVFGYLGPNGAGKTTTIRNIMGFVNADSGRVTVRGLDCRRERAQAQELIGYIPGETAFISNMRGAEFLDFMADMRQLRDRRRRDRLTEMFELDASEDIRRMSRGMKQKLALITAFMHDPAVYVLDEPTAGLDPLMQNRFQELISEERSRGKTVLMSSHIFEEVQKNCDRAGIIREGRLAAIEDVNSLNKMKSREFRVELESKEDVKKLMDSGLESKKSREKEVLVRVGEQYDDFIKTLSRFHVRGLDIRRRSLEDIFMSYYGKGADNAD